jgi:hypothetical protein
MYKDVAIFIPTRGRFKPALRRTVRNLCLEQLCRSNIRFENLKLVVPQEEVKEWHNTSIEIDVVDNGWRIEDIRQHILDKYQQYQYHIVLDDDLKLRKRNGPGNVDIKDLNKEDVVVFFDHVVSLLSQFAHGGIANEGLHPKPTCLYFNERVGGIHFYNSRILKECGVQYRKCPEYEDMHATLSLIKCGYPNVVSYFYAFKQKSNAVGGCSKYRTLKTQNDNANKFKEMHTNEVLLQKPKFSVVWKGMKVGVKVFWKKAFYNFHKCQRIKKCHDPTLVTSIVLNTIKDITNLVALEHRKAKLSKKPLLPSKRKAPSLSSNLQKKSPSNIHPSCSSVKIAKRFWI